MTAPLSPSGVLGLAGRVPAVDDAPVRSSALVLAGEPLPVAGTLRVYTCGITPYDVTHLGHAATFVWGDLLASVAREAGVTPVVCRNVTDLDDVLTDAASGRGWPYDEFALTQEFLFDRDMAALRVAAPAHAPHARAHVRSVVQLAAALLAADAAYERDGHVFFRGARAVESSGLGPVEAARRAEEFGDRADDGRDDPFDVPVWRPSSETQPAWPSPWGWGRPGWHAECAAMAWTVCGASVDVLAGGADLTFPHHAYQAAMVEAATGVAPFARRELHWGEVRHGGTKMAKSTGNLVLVGDLLADHRAAAVRLWLLHRRWAQAWDYRGDELAETETLLDDLYAAAGRPGPAGGDEAHPVLDRLLDDLDVPGAVEVARERGGAAARSLLRVLKLDA